MPDGNVVECGSFLLIGYEKRRGRGWVGCQSFYFFRERIPSAF
jgi:hypothetical protein